MLNFTLHLKNRDFSKLTGVTGGVMSRGKKSYGERPHFVATREHSKRLTCTTRTCASRPVCSIHGTRGQRRWRCENRVFIKIFCRGHLLYYARAAYSPIRNLTCDLLAGPRLGHAINSWGSSGILLASRLPASLSSTVRPLPWE